MRASQPVGWGVASVCACNAVQWLSVYGACIACHLAGVNGVACDADLPVAVVAGLLGDVCGLHRPLPPTLVTQWMLKCAPCKWTLACNGELHVG